MLQFIKHSESKPVSSIEKNHLIDFLFQHLDSFGDPKHHINKAIDYALKLIPSAGGFLLEAKADNQTVGVVVINATGMGGYIPENILVYIAVHKEFRGQKIGKKLMEEAMSIATGDIALHVEPDNPAFYLYKKLGFTNKYLEMRYLKPS
jgi:[ribosomal protein S18]-alanine N-acetyltransferase